jgi:2-keto-4-pentenoate hydratase/2-oxohepta-3-ene-1,7-dioic acid hydratase in catechol pathway
MRLVTLRNSGRPTAGVVAGDNVLSLAACAELLPAARSVPGSVRGILEAGDAGLDLVRSVLDRVMTGGGSLHERLQGCGALIPGATASLLAPIPDPRLVLSCGMNYKQHLHEMGGKLPAQPTAFLKSPNAVIGPGAAIVLPKHHSDMVDWEAEFSAVIGRRCHDVPVDEALDYVAGYTMVNDVSARNWVRRMDEMKGLEAAAAWDMNLLGKQFPTFCPMGPTVVTKDEIPDPDAVHFELKLNGQVMQSACTDDLAFNVATLIAYYSKWHVFQPGDVITTGSPAGVGMGRKPWVFLKAGDVVTLSADGVGTMDNPVVNEEAADRG